MYRIYPRSGTYRLSQAKEVTTLGIPKTGQTISYHSYDDGDLEAGRNVDFTTLEQDNPFGNTQRFTDMDGLQVYGNGIVCDWSTYNSFDNTLLCWYIGAFPSELLSTAINNANILVVDGFAAWKIPNIDELFSIANKGVAPHVFKYGPFNSILGTYYWSTTAQVTDTTMVYCGHYNGLNTSRRRIDSSYSLRCRVFNFENGIFS